MNSMKKQKDKTLKDELPRSEGAQYATGDQWRNNPRKNEETETKQKQYPAGDVTGDGSKVWCYKEQHCIGTWNVRSMNQGYWRLRVKWHRTRHTQETDDMHTPAGGTELGKKLIAIYYKSPQAEFQTAWISLFSTAQVHTCYRTAKGSEIHVYCRVCPSPHFLLITRRECSLVCRGPLNSRLCPDSLAERLVCKDVQL